MRMVPDIITITIMTDAAMTDAAMTDATGTMRLLTWLSPAFPTGAFAYSHGLEWAIETQDIRDGETLREWLSALIAHGSARTDTILLRHAHRAAGGPDTLRDIAALALACAASRERRDEAQAQGRAFLRAAEGWGVPELPENTPYAVAVGAMAGAHGIDETATAGAYLQTFISNLISAAVRLVPLGQTTGLQTLAALEPVILATVGGNQRAPRSTIWVVVRSAPISPRCGTKPNTQGCSAHESLSQRPIARGCRRSGRHRKNRVDGRLVQTFS